MDDGRWESAQDGGDAKPIGRSCAPAAAAEAAAVVDGEIRRLAQQCARLRYQWEHGLVPTRLSELEESGIEPVWETEGTCDLPVSPSFPIHARAAA